MSSRERQRNRKSHRKSPEQRAPVTEHQRQLIPPGAVSATLKRENIAMFGAAAFSVVSRLPRSENLPEWVYGQPGIELLTGYGHDVAGVGIWYFWSRGTLDRINPNWMVSRLARSKANAVLGFGLSCGFELMQKELGDRFQHLASSLPATYDEKDYLAYGVGLGLTLALKRWIDRPINDASKRLRVASS